MKPVGRHLLFTICRGLKLNVRQRLGRVVMVILAKKSALIRNSKPLKTYPKLSIRRYMRNNSIPCFAPPISAHPVGTPRPFFSVFLVILFMFTFHARGLTFHIT